jgi:hypothetical protein
MFRPWQFAIAYLFVAATALILTAVCTRRGLEDSLQRPIVRGFGPPCTLWDAWCLFSSFFWERLLLACTAIACGIRLYYGDWRPIELLIAAGVVITFPFQEYLTHRYLLHHRPIVIFGRPFESIIALVHRVHHRDPWHMERAINPPIAVVLYIVGLPVVFLPFMATGRALSAIAASWVVLLIYEWTHLLIHTSYVPQNWLFKRIWRNHRAHHFKNEHYWFNVSTYGVDSLLGTNPAPAEAPLSASCLTLEGQDTSLYDDRTTSKPDRPTGECLSVTHRQTTSTGQL